MGESTNVDLWVAGFIWAAMSHAQAAIIDRPVAAARSAPARALSPSAERYAPFVRIAALRAVWFRPSWPETSLASNYAAVVRVNSFISDVGRQNFRPRNAANRSCNGALSGQPASGPNTPGFRTTSGGAAWAAAMAASLTSSSKFGA